MGYIVGIAYGRTTIDKAGRFSLSFNIQKSLALTCGEIKDDLGREDSRHLPFPVCPYTTKWLLTEVNQVC